MDDGVESVVGIGGVLDGASAAVGLDEGIAALDDVTVARLLLRLDVTGQSVVHVVTVGVLRMGVVVPVDDLGVHGQRGGGHVVSHGDHAGVRHGGYEGREDDEL